MKLEDKELMFNFEKSFCYKNLRIWQTEAYNLFYSAEVLNQFELIKIKHKFVKNESFSSLFSSDLTDRAYFNFRTQRMLWAYAFENLLKLIILSNIKKENPDLVEVPLKEIKSHIFSVLARKADVELTEPEIFYSGILEKCSVWGGRYPLPLKFEQMYESREALSSREALLERSKQDQEKFMNGEIPRVYSKSDILHSVIGDEEYSIYQNLKIKLFDKIEIILQQSNV